MRYNNGQEVRLGDKVKLPHDRAGVVVFSIDTNEYAPNFPKESWEHLKAGVMIEFEDYGLIHYVQLEEDLELVARA